ncbi:GntR family transcriptional regulator [Lentilactobacillus diolivorans]|uniref:GntR family transcriptional regulator n=2 Tax=Lentilactobacillus diolivorans TaxID=179838 RepID=A0A0R1SNG0_9LACO|nr:GntR family transcriptional regulator [Lentilactobacillus diolivorans]KRL69236.1 GntR family transcriptional regulator [Lentilactobacillus diolivorans DSM 14421]GEP23914.1 GntR family transcriptional regulator [Lentilactobacillus diolivorans]
MESLNEVAYQTILNDILKLKFKPGERIQDRDLIERLKISRTPVREAILRLKNDGLMATVPQSGTYVTKISLKSALNARFVRQSVERDVVKEAAINMSESNILDAKNLISKQELATKQKNSEDFFYLDNDFHKMFYTATDKDEVWNWLKALTLQLDRYRFLRIQQTEMPVDKILQQHEGIVEAIKKHDKSLAGRRAFNHLNLMLAEKNNLLKKFPDYFEENR